MSKMGYGDEYIKSRMDDEEFQWTMIVEQILYQITKEMSENKITQVMLARKLGISRARISQILNNTGSKNPTFKTIYDVARAVGLTELNIQMPYIESKMDKSFSKPSNETKADLQNEWLSNNYKINYSPVAA